MTHEESVFTDEIKAKLEQLERRVIAQQLHRRGDINQSERALAEAGFVPARIHELDHE